MGILKGLVLSLLLVGTLAYSNVGIKCADYLTANGLVFTQFQISIVKPTKVVLLLKEVDYVATCYLDSNKVTGSRLNEVWYVK